MHHYLMTNELIHYVYLISFVEEMNKVDVGLYLVDVNHVGISTRLVHGIVLILGSLVNDG